MSGAYVRTLTVLSLSIALALQACREDGEIPTAELGTQLRETIVATTGEGLDALRMPDATDLDAIPQDPRNPLTADKVALGRLLFHETGLATEGKFGELAGTFSCASCHHAGAGFQANRAQGLGEGGVGFGRSGEGRVRAANISGDAVDAQPVRSPSALNVAYQELMLWNGQFGATGANRGTEAQWTPGTPKAENARGYQGVETQAIAGLKVHRLGVSESHLAELGYRDLFDAAFADRPVAERYSAETAGLAIAAYERTLLATGAPFQRWLRGDASAMSAQAMRGAIVFFDDGQCAGCHSGPSLAGMSFHALGMSDLHDCPEEIVQSTADMAAHKGRGGFTLRTDDLYAFKVPQLYNLTDSRFYGHGASFRSVAEVVTYKVGGVPQNARVPAEHLDASFRPLGLDDQQRRDLIAFLEDGLRDPGLSRYVPERLPSGACFPNADPLARAEMGCR